MQIVWQNWTLRYCDNGGCSKRRTVSAKTSTDGVAWGTDHPLITPDQMDPPELEVCPAHFLLCSRRPGCTPAVLALPSLAAAFHGSFEGPCSHSQHTCIHDAQFYRIRPFYIGNTTRLAAHTLQYAPSPSLDLLGWDYGRQPTKCTDGNGSLCHGPHMYEEWWVGPASGDAADTAGWRRPYRDTHAAPLDAFLMAPPVAVGDELVWLGSTGLAYTLPMYRIAGIYAPANGEFNTDVFVAAASPVWVNAAAVWHNKLVTGGCDEGCAAYLFAAVLDGDTGEAIEGYRVQDAVVMKNVDGQRLELQWRGRGGAVATTAALSGKRLKLRLYFRDAIVYAIGV